MASFSSSPTQFAPFTPSLNLDQYKETLVAETQALMYKQSQYNDNAQKIQGVMSSIMGIEVLRDQDKEYLEGLQNDLQSKLQTIASNQDLSNISNIQQAMSLASVVTKDKKIQQAANSTAVYKKMMGSIEQAHKEGKSSAANDNYVLRDIRNYMEGRTDVLNNKPYVEFYDYNKEWLNFLKARQVNIVGVQEPIGPDGSLSSDITEAYVLRDANNKQLSPEVVRTMFSQFIATNSQAATQLDIDSTYFSDTSDTNFVLTQLVESAKNQVSQRETELEKLKIKAAATNGTDPDIDSQIQLYEQKIPELKSRVRSLSSEYKENPEQFKKNYFKSNVINGMGDSFSFSQDEVKYIRNEAFHAKLNQDQFYQKSLNDERDYKLREAEHMLKVQEAAKKAANISDDRGVYVETGINTKTKPSTTEVDRSIDQLPIEINQNRLSALYEAGYTDSITLGRDSQGNVMYTWNGDPKQFDKIWRDEIATIESDKASPSIQRYFQNDDPHSGVNLETLYNLKVQQRDQIREGLNADPAAAQAHSAADSMVNSTSGGVVFSKGGVQITDTDYAKIIAFKYKKGETTLTSPVTKGLTDSDFASIGISPEKISLLKSEEISSFEGNRRGYKGGDLIRGLTQRLPKGPNKLLAEYSKNLQRAYDDNLSSTSNVVSIVLPPINGDKSDLTKQSLAALKVIVTAQQETGGNTSLIESFDKAASAKNATISAYKDPLSGKIFVHVTGEKGDSKPIQVTASNAQSLGFNFSTDGYEKDRLMMESTPNKNNVPQAPKQTPPYGTLKRPYGSKVQVRYGISKTGGVNPTYSPYLEYSIDNGRTYKKAPQPYQTYPTVEDAASRVKNMDNTPDEVLLQAFGEITQ